MLKTATLTWNSFYNYGTCLQAYALQHYIESLGYENHIMDDRSIIHNPTPKTASAKSERIWKRRFKKLLQSFQADRRIFFKYQRLLCSSIDTFKRNCLKVDYDITTVLKDESDYDVYICGSDQIWVTSGFKNPKWDFYYAAFTKRKKISYAPSIGAYQIDEKWKAKISGLIAPFFALSVREEAGKNALQELTNKKVELVVDPTLLLSKQEWEHVLPEKKKNDGKYVLGYILTPNDKYYRIAQDYAHQHGLKFYLFMLNLEDYGHADRLISGGPFDFLGYLRNADMVFTDSFHGTIFSTVFERPFYTFKRFADEASINQNSRIETLLKNMGAKDRLIDGKRPLAQTNDTPKFAEMKRRLEPFIAHSKEFLQETLSSIERGKD